MKKEESSIKELLQQVLSDNELSEQSKKKLEEIKKLMGI